MSIVMPGDIVCHPKGKALAQINPFNDNEVNLRSLSLHCDLGKGPGADVIIPIEELKQYEILKSAFKR